MGVSKNRGFPPKRMIYIMETPINPWMIWVEKNPPFSETPISSHLHQATNRCLHHPVLDLLVGLIRWCLAGFLSRHGGRDLWGRTVYLPTCFVVDFQIVKVSKYTVPVPWILWGPGMLYFRLYTPQVYKIVQKTTNGKDLVSKNVKKNASQFTKDFLVCVTWYEKCMKPTRRDLKMHVFCRF